MTQDSQSPRRGRQRRSIIPRQHLIDKAINASQDVILFMAPIGYGKTTIMKQIEAQSPHPVFLELGVDDANPITFINHLRESLQSSTGIFIKEFEEYSTWSDQLNVVLDALDRSRNDTQIFLDGSQVFNPSTADLLERFLDQLPTGHRCYIAGYNVNNLKLTSIYAQARVLTLGQTELAFNLSEIQFSLQTLGSSLDAEKIYQQSGGMALSIFIFISSNSLDPEPLSDVLLRVLNNLPPDIRQILPNLSVLESWDEHTVQQLEIVLPKDWFSVVSNSGLPINQISKTLLQPHNLLLEVLTLELRSDVNQYQEMNLRCAKWAVKQNFHITAIRRFLNANELELAQKHASNACQQAEMVGDYVTMLQYLKEFSINTLSPQLQIAKITALMDVGGLDESKILLDKLLNEKTFPEKYRLILICARASLYRYSRDFLGAIAYCREHRDEFESTNFSSNILIELVSATFEAQRYQQHLDLLAEIAEKLGQGLEDPFILEMSAKSNLALGNLSEAKKQYRTLLIMAEQNGNLQSSASAKNHLSILFALGNDAIQAREYINAALDEARRARPLLEPYYLSTRAEIESIFGNLQTAATDYSRAELIYKRTGFESIFNQVHMWDTMMRSGEIPFETFKLKISTLQPTTPSDVSELALFGAIIAFQEQRDDDVIIKANEAIKHSWVGVQIRAYGFLVAASHRAHHTGFRNVLENLNIRLAVLGSLRVFANDWHLLGPILTELRDSGLLLTGLILPKDMPAIPPGKPKLEIQAFGRYRIKLDGQDIVLKSDKSFEYLTYLALFGEKTIGEILEDFFVSDKSQRTKLDHYVKRLRQDFMVRLDRIDQNALFPYDTKTKRYGLGDHFRIELDAKRFPNLAGESLFEVYRGRFLKNSEFPWVDIVASQFETMFSDRAHIYAKSLPTKESAKVYEQILYIKQNIDDAAWQGWFQASLENGQLQQARGVWERWDRLALEHGFARPDPRLLKPLIFIDNVDVKDS
jgi:two-component SAPR family response regulator/tetratricopeptide (TPR) repeat protein